MNPLQQIVVLARYTLIEAIYTRFFIILFTFIGLSISLELFLQQIVIFEKEATQVILIATFLRFAAIYLMGLFVISSVTQEFNQHSIYLLMSLALSRTTYILGKLLGFSLLGFIICCLFGVLLSAHVEFKQLILWIISLYCELLLIISLAIFFSLSLQHTLPALSSLIGFYLLARSIDAIQLMSHNLQDSWVWSEQLLYYLSQLLALLLPDLSRFTRSEWLIYHSAQWDNIVSLLIQTIIYLILVISASLFDFYRRNL